MAGRGRPTVEEPRDTPLSVRFTKRERDLIDAAAEAAGLKPGAWARERLLAAAKRQK